MGATKFTSLETTDEYNYDLKNGDMYVIIQIFLDGVTYALRPEYLLCPPFSSWESSVSVQDPKHFKKSRIWMGYYLACLPL